MSGKREELGLVGYWDVVAWDEFEQQKGRAVDAVLNDTMQNYLANKSFNRGKGTHEASASMVFVGNTKHTVPFMLKMCIRDRNRPVRGVHNNVLRRWNAFPALLRDTFIQEFSSVCLHDQNKRKLERQ